MKRNFSNYIKANLIRIKIPNDSNLNSIVIKMEFGKQIQETEKLQAKELELSKVF